MSDIPASAMGISSENILPGGEDMQNRVDAALGLSNAPRSGQTAQIHRFDPMSLSDMNRPNIDMLMDVNLQLTVELGRTRMTVRQVLDLQNGSVVELDRIAGEAVDIFVNDRMLARGEVVVVDDKFGVRITELVQPGTEAGEAE